MDRRIKKTKTAIYGAFIRAKRNGADVKPSVKEICALADINKTTFYRYFSDVDSLAIAVIDEIINFLLIDGINVEMLLISPELYFGQVIKRYKEHESDFHMLFVENAQSFVFEAERLIKNKLVETTDKRYDDILLTFIAGGAVHFFMAENYYDESNLIKFCRIVRAAVAAFDSAK